MLPIISTAGVRVSAAALPFMSSILPQVVKLRTGGTITGGHAHPLVSEVESEAREESVPSMWLFTSLRADNGWSGPPGSWIVFFLHTLLL